jgi:hypothetical protein
MASAMRIGIQDSKLPDGAFQKLARGVYDSPQEVQPRSLLPGVVRCNRREPIDGVDLIGNVAIDVVQDWFPELFHSARNLKLLMDALTEPIATTLAHKAHLPVGVPPTVTNPPPEVPTQTRHRETCNIRTRGLQGRENLRGGVF